mmetsp:Transcript_6668/g.20283  ORF Transcript_6668/g.20283 Transcript_6668/m.20283 type:complete len:399 (-) Transcript_6668:63-1259(-)
MLAREVRYVQRKRVVGLGTFVGLDGGEVDGADGRRLVVLALLLGDVPGVLVVDPEGEDEAPGAEDGADGDGDEVEPEGVAEVGAVVDVVAPDDDAGRDEELVDDQVVEARGDEELDGEPDHEELGDGLGGDHLEPDGEADHPVAAPAAEDGGGEVGGALGDGGADDLAHVGVGVVAARAEVAGVVVAPLLLRLVVDRLAVLERVGRVPAARGGEAVRALDLDRLDEAGLPGEHGEVEDGAAEVAPPDDEPVDEERLDLPRALLRGGAEDGEGAEHVVRRDELGALAQDDEGEPERDAEAREHEIVDPGRRAPAAADLAGHEDPEREEHAGLDREHERDHRLFQLPLVDHLADLHHHAHHLGLGVEDALHVHVLELVIRVRPRLRVSGGVVRFDVRHPP